MANFDNFADLVQDVISRSGGEAVAAVDDFYVDAQRAVVRAYQEICNEADYLFTRADPPGAISTVAPITAGTVNVTNGNGSISFSSPPVSSVQGRKIIIQGIAEVYRIATHTGGLGPATLDAAFNGPNNAAATFTVFQDEYSLASDVRHIIGMFLGENSWEVLQRSQEWLRENYPDPPDPVWPPRYFARIAEQKIRFEGYPDRARRIEYPYTVIPTDIAGSVTILIPRNWRYVIADGGLYWIQYVKNDNKQGDTLQIFAVGKAKIFEDDRRKRLPLHGSRTEAA